MAGGGTAMLSGDLIRPKYRKPRNKQQLPVYTITRVNDDGTLEVQNLDTGNYKHISRPENYEVVKQSPKESPPHGQALPTGGKREKDGMI